MMYKTRVVEAKLQLYVEMDPSERYGRFKDILGKGAMKTVYRAFDDILGMEVAWNQVKLDNMLRSPEDLQRLYSEVHLLKNLDHESIMKFRASWIDPDRRTFNFITEMFTSGTLREYRKRYKRVSIGAIKGWARQILEGLEYLHCLDPPVIHRDLKCDNIFVNGHLGQVKIGDLGLAAILSGSQQAHSVIGTPEFMAPELYEEEYDELVDVYSFGMCVLEMLTSEYPYNECSNPAQIYKKVTSGKLPESFYRIEDKEARRFIGRCLEKSPNRPSAAQLLKDPFLCIEEVEDFAASTKIISSPQKPNAQCRKLLRGFSPEAPAPRSTCMAITGTINPDDDTIFLKVQISDKNGPARNIFFPFEITSDTALDVATEMVKELEIRDWEPSEIASMIHDEITRLVPSWKNSEILHKKQSFISYDDDGQQEEDNDDNSPHHPFYANSSLSSSQASLSGLFSSHDAQFYQQKSLLDWLHDEGDDASSQSSSCSDKYNNLNYLSASDEDLMRYEREAKSTAKSHQKCTRFCPEGSMISSNCNTFDCSSKPRQRMVRTGSLVDIRSQLLHRSLVEEINKRRMFNTVGAVEHIGYQEPAKSLNKIRRV